MSEYLAHTIVFDDTARLAQCTASINDTFKEVYRDGVVAGRLGSGTRKGGTYIVGLMERLRDRWQAGRATDDDRTILAFTLGWTTHRAADRHFKPLYAVLNADYDDEVLPKPQPIRIYHDVILYQEVMNHGRGEPTAPGLLDFHLESHPAAGALSPALTEALVVAQLQRSLLGLHSFVDEEENLEVWLTRFFERLEPDYVDLDRYARYYHEPDLDALRRLILDPNFYDANDPLIALARSVQQGQPDAGIDFPAAMTAAKERGSQYAQCLWLSMQFAEACSAFFEGDIDAQRLDDVLTLRHPDVQLD